MHRQRTVGSGFYVKMPQKRTVDGNYVDVAHPFNGETRKALNAAITDMYTSGKLRSVNQTDGKSEVKARNCTKYKRAPSDKSDKSAMLATKLTLWTVAVNSRQSLNF